VHGQLARGVEPTEVDDDLVITSYICRGTKQLGWRVKKLTYHRNSQAFTWSR
jgi:hypothetical protein